MNKKQSIEVSEKRYRFSWWGSFIPDTKDGSPEQNSRMDEYCIYAILLNAGSIIKARASIVPVILI